MKKQNLTFTVGVPTYYGGAGLVKTVKSILASKGVGKFRLIVSVDGNPLEKKINKQLVDLGVEVIDNKERGGQVARILQMISLCKTDLIILTQDDILFTPTTLKELVKGFEEHPDVTMESGRVVPLKPTTLVEKIIQVGVSISYTIGKNWKNGDNYFLAGGRCLAFRAKMAKKLNIPEEVLNSDTYLYFLNQQLGGSFLHIPSAVYHMRSPTTLVEHMKQSKKYQYVPQEIKHYLGVDVDEVQPLPVKWRILALVRELVKNPFLTVCYLGVLICTRTQKRDMYDNVTRFWETDLSTKQV